MIPPYYPDTNPNRASDKLQQLVLQTWLEQWRLKVNNTKSTQITFTTNRIVCPQTTIYNTPIQMKSEVTYLGLHLGQRFTYQAHIKAKRQQLNLSKNTTGLSAKPPNCQWKTNYCCIKPY